MKRKLLFRFTFGIVLFTSIPMVANAQAPSIEWQKTYGGTSFETAYSILQTEDGGYIAASIARSNNGDITDANGGDDFWLTKLDANGNLEWEKSFGGTDYDRVFSMQITNDGGYILVGSSWSTDGDITENKGGSDVWVVKTDSNGNLEWQKTYGGSGDDSGAAILKTSDNGYIMTGTTQSNDGDVSNHHGDSDIWLVKLDANGQILWQNAFGGSDQDWTISLQEVGSEGYLIAGTTRSSNGDIENNIGWDDVWVLMVDNTGALEWEKTYGGTDYEVANSIQKASDGTFVVAGYTWSSDGDVTENKGQKDFWVFKIDLAGNLAWQKTYGGSAGDHAYSMTHTSDDNFVVAGYTSSADGDITENKGGEDIWAIKIDESGELVWQKTFGGSAQDIANSVIENNEFSIILAGLTKSTDGDITENKGETDSWFIKLEAEQAGNSENELTKNIKIYPIPTDDFLNIELGKSYDKVDLSLMDFSGKLIDSQTLNNQNTFHYSLNQLKSGIYLLKIQTKDGSKTFKVIKK